jgi:hypothetical protein
LVPLNKIKQNQKKKKGRKIKRCVGYKGEGNTALSLSSQRAGSCTSSTGRQGMAGMTSEGSIS